MRMAAHVGSVKCETALLDVAPKGEITQKKVVSKFCGGGRHDPTHYVVSIVSGHFKVLKLTLRCQIMGFTRKFPTQQFASVRD